MASLELKFNELESSCQIEFTLQMHKIAFAQECEKQITATGVAGGAGTGRGSTTTTKLTTKDVKVEKLIEKADVAEVRWWQRTIELQLENVFGKTHIEDLIIGIRHQRSPITSSSWDELLAKLNGDGEGHKFQDVDWAFESESRWMHAYMISKLNTSLFSIFSNIQDQNGFELIRLINDHMDRIPENAPFHMGIHLQDAIRHKDGALKKCKSIVETSKMVYELDTQAIEYRKLVGEKPDGSRLKELLWQVIDPDTKVEQNASPWICRA